MSDQVPQQNQGTPNVAGTFSSVRLRGTGQVIGDQTPSTGVILLQILTAAGVLTNTAMFDENDTVNETRMWIARGGGIGLQRVTIGIADSGGVGFRLLRIPN